MFAIPSSHVTVVRELGIYFLLALAWFAGVLLLLPEPRVSLAFPEGEKAEVRQLVNDSGHMYLEVKPKTAAANFTYMTIAGISVFPRDWVVASVASTVPLGESEVVDFPRFFDLLPKLFLLARIAIAAFPLCLVLLFALFKYGFPLLRKRGGRRTFLVVLFVTTALSLPEPIADFAQGLDTSWSWFLCHFAFQNVFGSDVVFTYGPLGFLLNPQASWACVLCSLAVNLLFVVLWVRLLLRVYAIGSAGRAAAWFLIASTLIPMTMEWRWTLLSVLYAAVPVFLAEDEGEHALVEWCVAGSLAAFVSLMKFSSLTIVLGSQTFCIAAVAMRLRKKALRSAFVFGVSFSVVFTLFAICCFSSFGAFVAWIRGSLATASGYNLYMVAEKPWFELLFPVAIGLGFLMTSGWRNCILFAPILFFTAKYAWVRQTAGPMAYVAAILAAVCLLRNGNALRRTSGLFVVALALNVALALPTALSGLSDMQSLSGLKPLALYHTLTLRKTVSESLKRSAEGVSSCRLPSSWRDKIGDGSLAFIPQGHAPAMADPTLNLIPLPSLQLYSACHPYLDELNAAFFAKRAADFIVCEISAVACGNFINYPRTWKALLENYECIGHEGRFALLKPRAAQRTAPGESITLPSDLALFEKLRGVFLRNPIEHAELVGRDGTRTRIQLVRGNQGVPFPLAWIPHDDDEMLSILLGNEGGVTKIE